MCRSPILRFVLFVLAVLLMVGLTGPVVDAAPEKGKKCSDGIDNDGDGKIDGDDPDCADEGDPSGDTVVQITLNWDLAVTHDTFDVAVDCHPSGAYCDVTGVSTSEVGTFTFTIPESYWSQWSLQDARSCFGSDLGYGDDAEVVGLRFRMRDHHGSPEHWLVQIDYSASTIASQEVVDHHANFQGDCPGACDDLSSPGDTTSSYPSGELRRTQTATASNRGKGSIEGTPCTCAGEDCAIDPNLVTVTVAPPPPTSP